MIKRPPEPKISMKGQAFFLLLGLAPLGMLVQFWLRSGTGLNSTLWGFTLLIAAGFLVSLNYFLFYRQNKPRTALVPPGPMKAFFVAALLIPLGAFNLLATNAGLGLTLSPGPRIEAERIVPTLAKVLLMKPVEVPERKKLDLSRQNWLVEKPYLKGSLWGALGYALAFALAGALFGLMRREVVDPRDEHLGSGAFGGLVRSFVGLFYGSAMGFALGALLIFILRTMFGDYRGLPPAFLHWVYVFGAASNPNVAFSYAFTTASMLAGGISLVWGSRDFTAAVSDPKAPELTRPVEVRVPPVPPVPGGFFDPARMQHESQQILTQFNDELKRVFTGPQWDFERYELAPVGRAGEKPEPAAANIISARTQEEDDYNTAMGSLSSVYVQITAELGKFEISAADWMTLAEGAMLALPRSPDGTVLVRINGKLAGKGRALTLNGNKAVKMIQLKGKIEQLVKP